MVQLVDELMSYSSYNAGETIYHWKSASGYEVDFILGDHTSIEIKAKQSVSIHDLKSLLHSEFRSIDSK